MEFNPRSPELLARGCFLELELETAELISDIEARSDDGAGQRGCECDERERKDGAFEGLKSFS